MIDEHAIDELSGQDARVREVSVMLPTDGPISEDKLKEVRASVARYIKARGYSQELVAQKIDTNVTYVSCFLSGKVADIPAATLQKLCRRINEWCELDAKRSANEQPGHFYETPVSRRGLKVIRHTVETRDVGVITSPGGTGKTSTLLQAQRLIPASIYLLLTTDCRTRSGFLKALYEAIYGHKAPARVTLADVLERLKYSDRLLMLDNADVLDPAVYFTLMDLIDVARIPIVLAGTHRLLAKLTHDADPLRGQLSSRIGMRAELLPEVTSPKRGGRGGDWISADQVRAMFERGKVKLHPAAANRLRSIANWEIGHLRRCERIMRYATIYAGKGSGVAVVTLDVLERAIALVDGLPTARTVGGEVEREAEAAIA